MKVLSDEWFESGQKLVSDSNKRVIMIGFITLFTVYFIYSDLKSREEYKMNGKYSVAYFKIFDGSRNILEFEYNGKMYSSRCDRYQRYKKVAFVRFLDYDPKSNYLIYKLKVPECLHRDSIPTSGWKELPVITCPE